MPNAMKAWKRSGARRQAGFRIKRAPVVADEPDLLEFKCVEGPREVGGQLLLLVAAM